MPLDPERLAAMKKLTAHELQMHTLERVEDLHCLVVPLLPRVRRLEDHRNYLTGAWAALTAVAAALGIKAWGHHG